ncbi:hypothetical protein F5Y03DRAFT_398124 [Xylaria venustula]|nr:hypothetical protein F5Y03DRAFT_398124 [Xylaria venustula]
MEHMTSTRRIHPPDIATCFQQTQTLGCDSLRVTFDVIGIDSPQFGSHEALSCVWCAVAGEHKILIHTGATEQAVGVTPSASLSGLQTTTTRLGARQDIPRREEEPGFPFGVHKKSRGVAEETVGASGSSDAAEMAPLIWGEAEMEWLTLSGVCERLQGYYHLRRKFKIRTDEVRYLFHRFTKPGRRANHGNRFQFIYELHRARRLKFSDQRDRKNYERTAAEVYSDVAKRALQGERGTADDSALITLAAVQHTRLQTGTTVRPETTSNSNKGDKLLSWVPDWRILQSFILTEPVSPHKAHGTSPRFTIDDNSSALRISGFEIDTIEACSRPLGAGEFCITNSAGDQEPTITHIWRSICPQNHFNLSQTYVNGESTFLAYMQTVSDGCVQTAKRENSQYGEIPKSR